MRYYHGLIDTQFLASGADYGKLPEVVVIVILPYDPFDENRMVYTIQNCCKEVPSLAYDDGARKIFYIQKEKKEVSISYMKSWEIEEKIRKESYDEGHDAGYSEGQGEGQDRVNLLNTKLGEDGRLDDIIKAARDKAYQESLFEELGL